jgi:hypothetical protein
MAWVKSSEESGRVQRFSNILKAMAFLNGALSRCVDVEQMKRKI